MEVGLVECLCLTALLLSAAYVYLTWNFNVWKNMGISGPKSWPLLGTMPNMMLKPIFQVDVDYQKKYGKIYGVFEGRRPALMVADLEMLKSIFVKDFSHFCDRRTFDLSSIDPVFNAVLTSLEGEKWKLARSILSPAFTSGKLKAMTELIATAGNGLASVLENKADQDETIDTKETFGFFTLDVVASCGFGVEVNSLEDPSNPFVVYARRINNFNNFWLIVVSIFPFLLKYFRLPFMDYEAVEFFKKSAITIVEERKLNKQRRADFLQLMLEAEEPGDDDLKTISAPVSNKSRNKFLTNEMIVGQSIQFFLAGFETVSLTLCYVAYCLAIYPEHQEKVVKEVDEAIEKYGKLTYDAVTSMTYLDMFISETLRMYPVAFRAERKCVEDYTYKGITIKKGTMVGIPVYAIHHNEENYPNPEEFCPDRFSSENKGKINSMAYLPFGAGPRNCIGLRFALLECKVALAQILRKVVFVTCPDTQIPLKYKPRNPKFYPENGIQLKTQRRSS